MICKRTEKCPSLLIVLQKVWMSCFWKCKVLPRYNTSSASEESKFCSYLKAQQKSLRYYWTNFFLKIVMWIDVKGRREWKAGDVFSQDNTNDNLKLIFHILHSVSLHMMKRVPCSKELGLTSQGQTVWEGCCWWLLFGNYTESSFPKVKNQPFRDSVHSSLWPRLQNRTSGTVRRAGVKRNGQRFKHFGVNKSSGLELTIYKNIEQEQAEMHSL